MPANGEKPSSAPNIVLIITDQQRRDTLGTYGTRGTATPNIDRLARTGVTFDRAYVANPLCTPSRTSLLSGAYPTRHGVWNNGIVVPRDRPLLSHRLAAIGYETRYIGKLHMQPHAAPPDISRESILPGWQVNSDFGGPYYGFETVELSPGHSLYGIRGSYGKWVHGRAGHVEFGSNPLEELSWGAEAIEWELPVALHQTSWLVERTRAFLSSRNRDRPFFLCLGFQDPHHPHAVPRDWDKRTSASAFRAPRFSSGELDDKPQYFRDIHEGNWDSSNPLRGEYSLGQFDKGRERVEGVPYSPGGIDFSQIPVQDASMARWHYQELCSMVDSAVGQILDACRAQNVSDSTIVVFTSDHGDLMGDHGLWMKGPFHFDELVAVPLIINWPGRLPESKRVRGVTSLVDLAPTLLGLAGQSIQRLDDGFNLAGVLVGKTAHPRKAALIEYWDDPNRIVLKTIVTRRHKLTVYSGALSGGELYDLEADPHETNSLWSHPDARDTKDVLMQELLREVSYAGARLDRIAKA